MPVAVGKPFKSPALAFFTYLERLDLEGEAAASAERKPRDEAEAHRKEWDTRGRKSDYDETGAPTQAKLKHDLKLYRHLQKRFASVNERLRAVQDRPDSPEAQRLIAHMQTIVKKMHRLETDTGAWHDIQKPGGPRDVIIIGGGPGGAMAAIHGGYEGLDTLILEQQPHLGGQSKASSRVENVGGYPAGATGAQIARDGETQARRLGAEVQTGVKVLAMRVDERGFKHVTIQDADGNVREEVGRAVILAAGLKFRTLGVPGDDHPNVVVGDFEKLKAIVGKGKGLVAGGSNGAAQAGLGLAKSASEVQIIAKHPLGDTMSHSQHVAVLNQRNPKIHVTEEDEIKSIHPNPDGTLTVHTVRGDTYQTKAVGVFIGADPETGWLPPELQREPPPKDPRAAKRYDPNKAKIMTDDDYETSIPGVFAVGDVRHGSVGRIVAAQGEGAVAVSKLFSYFQSGEIPMTPEERKAFIEAQQRAAEADAALAALKEKKRREGAEVQRQNKAKKAAVAHA